MCQDYDYLIIMWCCVVLIKKRGRPSAVSKQIGDLRIKLNLSRMKNAFPTPVRVSRHRVGRLNTSSNILSLRKKRNKSAGNDNNISSSSSRITIDKLDKEQYSGKASVDAMQQLTNCSTESFGNSATEALINTANLTSRETELNFSDGNAIANNGVELKKNVKQKVNSINAVKNNHCNESFATNTTQIKKHGKRGRRKTIIAANVIQAVNRGRRGKIVATNVAQIVSSGRRGRKRRLDNADKVNQSLITCKMGSNITPPIISKLSDYHELDKNVTVVKIANDSNNDEISTAALSDKRKRLSNRGRKKKLISDNSTSIVSDKPDENQFSANNVIDKKKLINEFSPSNVIDKPDENQFTIKTREKEKRRLSLKKSVRRRLISFAMQPSSGESLVTRQQSMTDKSVTKQQNEAMSPDVRRQSLKRSLITKQQSHCVSPVVRRQSSREKPVLTLQSSGEKPALTRQSSGEKPALTRQSSGEKPALTQQSSGEKPALTRQSSGEKPASTRQSSGEKSVLTLQNSSEGDIVRQLNTDANSATKQLSSGERSVSRRRNSGKKLIIRRQNSGERPIIKRLNLGERRIVKRQNSGERPVVARQNSGERSIMTRQNSGEKPIIKRQNSGERPVIKRQNSGEMHAMKRQKSRESPVTRRQIKQVLRSGRQRKMQDVLQDSPHTERKRRRCKSSDVQTGALIRKHSSEKATCNLPRTVFRHGNKKILNG